MYKVRNTVYSEGGKILIGENKIGYKFDGDLEDFTEESIYIEDMKVENGFIRYSNGRIIERYNPKETYESLKAKIVKRQFSNDDQIAIILNKDSSPENAELYNKMQEWREWAGILANKIASLSTGWIMKDSINWSEYEDCLKTI